MMDMSVTLFVILYQLEFSYIDKLDSTIILNVFIVVLIFFLGLLIGRRTIRFKKDVNISNEEELVRKKEKQNQSVSQITQSKNLYEDLIFKNAELSREISHLKNDKFQEVSSIVEPHKSKSLDLENIVFENLEKSQELQSISAFFKYPEVDGSFKMIHGTATKDVNSYFEIIYKENFKEGKLKFIADRSSYGKILTIRETSLTPVSEIENLGEINRPTNITVIENGIVEIKDDLFSIKEGHKLKIKIS